MGKCHLKDVGWEENGLAGKGRELGLGRAGTGTFVQTMGRAPRGSLIAYVNLGVETCF